MLVSFIDVATGDEVGNDDDVLSEATEDGVDDKPAVKDEECNDGKPEVGDSDGVSEATATCDNEADASLIKLGQGAHDTIFSPVHISLTYHVEKLPSLSSLPRLEYFKMNSFRPIGHCSTGASVTLTDGIPDGEAVMTERTNSSSP
mmetsp:Transcript_8289/g.13683  ORF Transcript_8289/g.13683 Transcript_8289/m.13683 type:complete len:146 (-) Transcript_8289:68-505(-)